MAETYEQFEKDTARDINENKLSQNAIKSIINDDTSQWIKSILSEKKSVINSVNIEKTQNQSRQRVALIETFDGSALGSGISSPELQSQSTESSSSEARPKFNCNGFQLYGKLTLIDPIPYVYLTEGLIANKKLTEQFSNGQMGLGKAASSTRYVYALITVDQENGKLLTSRIEVSGDIPMYDPTQVTASLLLGSFYGSTITNYGCGSVNVSICRAWYRSSPPFYSVSMTRDG